jgi:NAD(P)-dependent dehydrogenase (short-subunit alcohol dehydrogenase family)
MINKEILKMTQLPLNIDFSGKVVVVTGAGGVICGAMARAFAESGAKVAALDLNEEAVKKLADELNALGLPTLSGTPYTATICRDLYAQIVAKSFRD